MNHIENTLAYYATELVVGIKRLCLGFPVSFNAANKKFTLKQPSLVVNCVNCGLLNRPPDSRDCCFLIRRYLKFSSSIRKTSYNNLTINLKVILRQ